MTIATFQAIHKQIEAHAAKLTFYSDGEPMLNPHLFGMIELATRDNNVFTSFSTNFTQMKESLLGPMFASRVDWISVSIDGFHQSTYQKYRVGGDVKSVLNGISMTMQHKHRHGFQHPYMIVNMISFSHVPLEEQELLRKFCTEQGVDEFHLRPDQYGIMGPYDPTIVRRPANRCHWPWLSMSIAPDGAVFPCPIAFEQRISYGNLLTENLEDIWNNDLYVATREYLSRPDDDRSDMPKLPCFDCRFFGKCAPVSDVVQIRRDWLRESNKRTEHRPILISKATSSKVIDNN
jgi:radical SAM protein with 4Fe4S-binding SPASM domain